MVHPPKTVKKKSKITHMILGHPSIKTSKVSISNMTLIRIMGNIRKVCFLYATWLSHLKSHGFKLDDNMVKVDWTISMAYSNSNFWL